MFDVLVKILVGTQMSRDYHWKYLMVELNTEPARPLTQVINKTLYKLVVAPEWSGLCPLVQLNQIIDWKLCSATFGDHL
ncbi:hypothetical protein TNCV_3416331 [Trichonephila clavipes]|nr:hypothetical protein TNCV_3416331 [Trichonephila clavipes]